MPLPLHTQSRPVMGATHVIKPEMDFTWVGMVALVTIGVLAVVYGREHEEESRIKKRALQARGR